MRKGILFLFILLVAQHLPAQEDSYATDTVVGSGTMEPAERQGNFLIATSQPPVDVRTLPPRMVDSLKKSDDYWYANRPPKKPEPVKRERSDGGLLAAKWFQNLLWVIILTAFIGVVVWYLASSNILLFRKSSKRIDEDAPEEELGEDIFSINYEREIQKAEAAGNYRLAVRLWFLRTLKELSQQGLIQYRPEKPDGDYVSTLYGGPHYQSFFALTRAFEYTWYGQFPINDEAYASLQSDFRAFTKNLAA